MKRFLLNNIAIALMATIMLVAAAEINYRVALNAARNSELTDEAIEHTMLSYHFIIEAMNPAAPSLSEKINAFILYF